MIPIAIMERTEAASSVIREFGSEYIGCSVIVNGDLGTDDVIAVKYVGSDSHETVAYNSDEEILVLSKTVPRIRIDGPMKLSFTKDVTDNAVGIDICILE